MLVSGETFKKDVLSKTPPRNEPPLPPDWSHVGTNFSDEKFDQKLFTLHMNPTLEKLHELVEKAGGEIIKSGTFEPGLPHYLAYIPHEYVEQIKDERKRVELLRRWDSAYEKWRKGAEHPPVWVLAEKEE